MGNFTKTRSQEMSEIVRNKKAAGVRISPAVSRETWLARLAEIPPDSRTAAQRLMGDPVFERSALALRR